VALNLLLLPALGAVGACCAAIASDLAMVLALQRVLGGRSGLVRMALAAGPLALALAGALAALAVPWWGAAALILALYPPLLWLAGAYHPRELRALVDERTSSDASRYA
jgi:hypothetical protein